MWNIKNLLAGLVMVILVIYAVRGVFLTGRIYYLASLVLCGILAVSFFRNAKR